MNDTRGHATKSKTEDAGIFLIPNLLDGVDGDAEEALSVVTWQQLN